MAKGTSVFTGNIDYPQYQQLTLEFNIVQQDIANNRTQFTYSGYLDGISGGSGSTQDGSYNLTGAYTRSESGKTWSWSTTKTQAVTSGTFWVSHGSDGTLSNQSLSLKVTIVTKKGTGTATVNLSLSVPDIPRASTITTFNNFTIGSNIPWAVDRKHSSYTHFVELRYGRNVITSMYSTSASGKLSISSANKATMLGLLPNNTSGTFNLRVRTYTNSNYDVQVGDAQTESATGSVGSDIKPSISISHAEQNSTVSSLVGAYVQNQSSIKITPTISAGTGATVSSRKITFNGVSTTSTTLTRTPSSSGNLTCTVEVTDSRGRSATETTTINVLAWQAPRVDQVSFVRCNSDGSANLLGSYIKIRARVRVSSLVNGTEKNSIWYQSQTKKSADTSYVTKTDTTNPAITYTFEHILSGYSQDFSFDARLRGGDIFVWGGWIAGIISTGQLLMEWYKLSMSVGMLLPSTNHNLFIGPLGMKSYGSIIDKNGNEVLSNVATLIPSNANLNDYDKEGLYYNPSNANVGTMSNSPLARSFAMLVMKHAGVAQFWIEYVANGSQRIFTRNRYGTSWSSWLEIYHSGNRPIKYQHNVTITNGTGEIMMFNFINWSETPYTSMNLIASSLYTTAHVNKENALTATGVIVRSGANRFISGVFTPNGARLDYVYAESTGAISVSNTAGWTSAVINDYVQSV